MDLLIRPVRRDDAAGIVRILNPIIAAGVYTALDEPLSVEFERAYIDHFSQRGIFFVAERQPDGLLVGLQSLEPFATYTHAFDHVGVIATYVDLEQGRRGVGARLAQVTLPAARAAGYEKLFTYVRADNPAALTYYLGLGFQVVGTARRQAKIGGQYIDEVLIERFL
jgi:L-amino acid N-acyltransferase YncA